MNQANSTIGAIEDEQSCITRCRQNPHAFGEIYDRHFQSIFNYVLYRIANVADAEDVTAQVFFKAFRAISRFRFSGVSISAWLYRIAGNEIKSFHRKNKSYTQAEISTLENHLPSSGQDLEAELQKAEAHLLRQRIFLQIHQCMQELKPIDQELIVLRFFLEKSYADIANILGKRAGTLMTRTSRAVRRLQKIMESRGLDHGAIEKNTQELA